MQVEKEFYKVIDTLYGKKKDDKAAAPAAVRFCVATWFGFAKFNFTPLRLFLTESVRLAGGQQVQRRSEGAGGGQAKGGGRPLVVIMSMRNIAAPFVCQFRVCSADFASPALSVRFSLSLFMPFWMFKAVHLPHLA